MKPVFGLDSSSRSVMVFNDRTALPAEVSAFCASCASPVLLGACASFACCASSVHCGSWFSPSLSLWSLWFGPSSSYSSLFTSFPSCSRTRIWPILLQEGILHQRYWQIRIYKHILVLFKHQCTRSSELSLVVSNGDMQPIHWMGALVGVPCLWIALFLVLARWNVSMTYDLIYIYIWSYIYIYMYTY